MYRPDLRSSSAGGEMGGDVERVGASARTQAVDHICLSPSLSPRARTPKRIYNTRNRTIAVLCVRRGVAFFVCSEMEVRRGTRSIPTPAKRATIGYPGMPNESTRGKNNKHTRSNATVYDY